MNRNPLVLLPILCAFFGLSVNTTSAQSTTNVWLGGSADWNDSANWSLTSVPNANTAIARFSTNGNTTPTLGSGTTTVQRLEFNGSTSFSVTGQGSNNTTLRIDPNTSAEVPFIAFTNGSATLQTLSALTLDLNDTDPTGRTGFYVAGGKTLTFDSTTVLNMALSNTLRIERIGGAGSNAVININGVLKNVSSINAITIAGNGNEVLNLNLAAGSSLNSLQIGNGGGGVVNIVSAPTNLGASTLRYGGTGATFNLASSGLLLTNGTVNFNSGAVGNTGQSGTLGATYTSGSSTFTGNVQVAARTNASVTNTISVADGATLELAGLLRDGSALTKVEKTGGGALLLSRADGNTFAAGLGVSVSEGSLLLANSSVGSSGLGNNAVTVAAGATFGGSGRMGSGSSVTVNSGGMLQLGLLQAGSALTIGGNLTMDLDSKIVLSLGASGAADRLVRTGGTWSFQADQLFAIDGSGAEIGTYTGIMSGLAADPTVSGWRLEGYDVSWYNFEYSAGSVNLEILNVPEPSVSILLALSAVGVALYRFQRRRHKGQ